MPTTVKEHIISALVQNEAGTLNRLVSLFRRRGFSLGSMNAGDCEQSGLSRCTMVLNADQNELNQCLRQLEKLIDVVEVEDLQVGESVRREVALIRVDAASGQRSEVVEIVNVLGGKIVHLTQGSITVEFTEEPQKIDQLVHMLEPYGIGEIVRTGMVAIKTPRVSINK
jgi:acetolactate synthase-1/3 small subunit